MPVSETIVKSCLFISDVSCYDVVKDFSGPLVTIIVAIFAVRYAFKQISKQHENTLNAQKEESKRNTRIELFKDISTILDQSTSIILDVSTYCMVKKYSNIKMKSEINHEEYLMLNKKFSEALLVIISKIESYEIVNLMLFRVFRFAIQSILYDLRTIQSENDRFHVLENF